MGAEPVYFEIPADDLETMTDFYTTVMDWTIGDERVDDYRAIQMGEDRNEIVGGIYTRSSALQAPLVYYRVKNIDVTTERVVRHGGQVVDRKSSIKGIGHHCTCLDPEGNPFGLWMDDTAAE